MMHSERQKWIEDGRAAKSIERLCADRGLQLKKIASHEYAGSCPKCGGTDRFSINTKDQVFNCRGCTKGGKGPIDLTMFMDGIELDAAVEKLTGKPPPKLNGHAGKMVEKGRWIYRNADSRPYLRVRRFEDEEGNKSYYQAHWDGQWLKGKPAGPKIPYRLPELLDSDRSEPVYICEGEKCADAVAGLGLTATSASEGAGKWTPDLNEWFRDRIAYILPDNDAPGRNHAKLVAQNLAGIARDIRIVELPGLGDREDAVEWIKRGGNRDQLDQLGEAAPPYKLEAIEQRPDGSLGEQPELKPAADGIKLEYFDEFTTKVTSKPWLIKNVMAQGEISSWIAPPGGGKSAGLTDIAVHGGAFPEWRGYRVKQRFGTVYFALERSNLVKLRLKAYRLRDNLNDLPIAVAGQVIDLMDKTCVLPIADAIKQAEDHYQVQIGLAVFDTWSKGIAAGGGDENSARDQNVALANLRRVIDRVPTIHIATIGHTGKDEKKGQRGSNAKRADDDVEVQISGDTVKTATVNKANDQQQGILTSYSLEPYVFGLDEDGDEERTFILSRKLPPKIVAAKPNLSANQKVAMQSLDEALLSQGVPAPAEYELPVKTRAITLDQYKTELERQGAIDKHGSNPRARFAELCKSLKARQLIGLRDDWVWDARTSP